MNEVGYVLKLLRKEKKLSQELMAECANISRNYYQRLESGKGNPTFKVLFFLSNALEIKIYDLTLKKETKKYKKEDIIKIDKEKRGIFIKNMLIILGEVVYKLRKEQGLTQKELAKKAHINIKYFGKIERGIANPSIYKMVLICNSLNIKLFDFFQKIEKRYIEIFLDKKKN